jgi:hypothetical protein
MTIDIMIIIFLLTAILCAVTILGNNNDHYSGSSLSKEEFLRLYDSLNQPPVFQKTLFFRSYLVIVHQGFFLGTLRSNFSEEEVKQLKPFHCSRKRS